MSELIEALEDLAEAARNACDARQHPALTEALFNATWLISKAKAEGSPPPGEQPSMIVGWGDGEKYREWMGK